MDPVEICRMCLPGMGGTRLFAEANARIGADLACHLAAKHLPSWKGGKLNEPRDAMNSKLTTNVLFKGCFCCKNVVL